MTGTSLDHHIKEVLTETIKIVFPVNVEPANLIKRHVWRDKKYLGTAHNKVVAWCGWSANLVSVDFRYRAIFIDVVDNILPFQERERLFGRDFSDAISNKPQFVVMFVLDFPTHAIETIKTQGFVPRKMGRVLHACVIASIEQFHALPALYWAAKTARLVMLQRVLSIHRKPFDANEIPLQNLLYKTGYLHSYIANGGLELHAMSKPRKSGEFGHDFQAIVRNPGQEISQPFLLGIEIYTGPIGYHAETIPQYVNIFQLKGIIVIAKDDPFPVLNLATENFSSSIIAVDTLSNMGKGESIAIHHLPLDKIVSDLASIRDELEILIPTVPISN
jgi:hypothetical protein